MKVILWTSPTLHSAEYFTLTSKEDSAQLKGTINLWLEGQPTQVIYTIDCDLNWITRRITLKQRRPDGETHLVLTVDEALNWYDDGTLLPWAAGLTDIDLSITPSTNMLPLCKHNLQIGESLDVNCVWVQPPSLSLSTLPQHYTRIDAQHYDYAAPSLDYRAVLSVDEDNIVLQYGDLWNQLA
ncbi:MAG: putative glycolipid-binding domain-containing protein [Chloroflexi bacterium]|nr:putative glycolipid-binding domain-containing protein [Chloroflexota bacterium]